MIDFLIFINGYAVFTEDKKRVTVPDKKTETRNNDN